MLQAIRDKSQGWVVWVIVVGICAIFALWGVRSYLYHNAAEDAVVKVNGINITQREYSVAYNQLQRQAQLQFGSNYRSDPKVASALKDQALQGLISNLVLTQAATDDGFAIAPQLVEIALAKMPIFQINGAFSKERFMQVLQELLYSPNDFIEQLKNDMLIGQAKNGITETAFVLPYEINQLIHMVNQQRQFNYTIIPLKRFNAKIQLAPDAALTYYKNNQNKFKISEKVSVAYLQLSVTDLMKKIQPSTATLQQFYQNNISSYTEPEELKLASILIATPYESAHNSKILAQAQEKITSIAKQLRSGADFDVLRAKYSEDAQASLKPTQLPWTNVVQLDPQLRNVIAKLHVGDISVPVKTGRGYEVVKIIANKPAKVLPFQQVKQKALQMYQQRNAEQQFSNLSDQLANITYEKPNSLEPAAKQLGLTINTTAMFTKAGSKSGITADPKIITAAFSDNVLVQNNNSDPINLNDNSVIVLRIKNHIAAKVKPFAEVKDSIVAQLKEQAAQKQAQQLGQQIVAALNQGKTLAQLSKQYNLTIQTAKNALRHEAHSKIEPEVLTQAFLLAKPSKAHKTVNAGFGLQSGDFAVISLNQVQEGDVTKINHIQKQSFAEGLRNAYGQLDYNLYVQHLMKQATIKHYQAQQDDNM